MKLKIWSIYKQDDSDRGVELFTSEAEYNARRSQLIEDSPVGEDAIKLLRAGKLEEAWDDFCDASEMDLDHYEADAQEVDLPAQFDNLLTALEKCEHVIGMEQLRGKLSNNALSPVSDALVAARRALDAFRN